MRILLAFWTVNSVIALIVWMVYAIVHKKKLRSNSALHKNATTDITAETGETLRQKKEQDMESKNIVDEYLDKKIKEAEEQSRLEKEKPNVPKRRGFFKGFVSCIFRCIINVFKWIVLGLVFIIIDIYSLIERLFSGSRMNIGAKSQKSRSNTVRTDQKPVTADNTSEPLERNFAQEREQAVEDLFQKMKGDIFVGENKEIPLKIILWNEEAELIGSTGEAKRLPYKTYGVSLLPYSYYWTSGDREISHNNYGVNQQLKLASKIDRAFGGIYSVNSKTDHVVRPCTQDGEYHVYYQLSVEMTMD